MHSRNLVSAILALGAACAAAGAGSSWFRHRTRPA